MPRAMRHRPAVAVVLALASTVVPGAARAQDYFEQWPADLQTEVTHVYHSFSGEVMLYVKDLQSGFRYTHNSATPMYIASGVKMAIMVELFRQLKSHQVRLDEELVYGPGDVRDGAPVLSLVRNGTSVSLRFLLQAMIQQSDNAAADMILRRIGVTNVNKGLVEEGIFGFGPITTLLDVRKLVYKEVEPRAMQLSAVELTLINGAGSLDMRAQRLADVFHQNQGVFTGPDIDRAFRAYYRSGLNSAPLDAVGMLLERLAKKKLVSEEASREMLDLMTGTRTGSRRVRAGLPINTVFAHKTGTQYKRICDLGIFYLAPDRPIVLAACIKGGQNRRKAEEVIAHLAQRTYWLLLPPERRPAAELQIQSGDDEEEDLLWSGKRPAHHPAKGAKTVKRPIRKRPTTGD